MPDVEGNVPAVVGDVGETRVEGDLSLLVGVLQIDLGSAVECDSVSVGGTLRLGGALDVRAVDGFVPAYGDRWRIGTASAVTGGFDSVPEGFAVETVGKDVYLVAVPEPGTVALACGIPALLEFGRRRR
jgi:hypothetical protein